MLTNAKRVCVCACMLQTPSYSPLFSQGSPWTLPIPRYNRGIDIITDRHCTQIPSTGAKDSQGIAMLIVTTWSSLTVGDACVTVNSRHGKLA
jgi:hypothetical protein